MVAYSHVTLLTVHTAKLFILNLYTSNNELDLSVFGEPFSVITIWE